MWHTRILNMLGASFYRFVSLVFVVASLALGGCGGGSSSGSPETRNQSVADTVIIQGLAANSAPIAGATVSASCADQSGFISSVVTAANGEFSGKVNASALPCALQVTDSATGITLHSLAWESGITNITLLTDLTIAYYANLLPADWYYGDIAATDLAALKTAMTRLLSYLSGIGYELLSADYDPFAQRLNPNDNIFYVLYQLEAAIAADPDLTDYLALLAWLLNVGLDSLPTVAPISSEPVTAANRAGIWQVCDYIGDDYEMFEETYQSDGSWTVRIYKLSGTRCDHADASIPYETYIGTETIGELVTLDNGDTAYEVRWNHNRGGDFKDCFSLVAIDGDHMLWGRRTDTYDCDTVATRPVSLHTGLPMYRR